MGGAEGARVVGGREGHDGAAGAAGVEHAGVGLLRVTGGPGLGVSNDGGLGSGGGGAGWVCGRMRGD